MKIRMAAFRKVSLGILLMVFILSASSCASSKASARRRMIESEQSYQMASNKGLSGTGRPDRAPQTRAQKRQTMKGPYKPKQDNYQQNSGPQGEHEHDNGLGDAIGGLINWILNGLFGSR